MKANEVMIGNLIQWKSTGNIEVVLDIVTYDKKQYNINNVNITDCEPIPLTEEWLLNFGFKRISGSIGWDTLSDGKVILVDVPTNKGNIIAFNYAPSKYCFIKSVHQLQNLYYALTGNELTLKP